MIFFDCPETLFKRFMDRIVKNSAAQPFFDAV